MCIFWFIVSFYIMYATYGWIQMNIIQLALLCFQDTRLASAGVGLWYDLFVTLCTNGKVYIWPAKPASLAIYILC